MMQIKAELFYVTHLIFCPVRQTSCPAALRQSIHEASQSLRSTSPDKVQSYLVPENGIRFVAAHRQGVTLEAQVHRRIVVPDIWHVLQRANINNKRIR